VTASTLPVWRSLLFVPVTAKRFVDGAARRGADAIILDLEDSVAASEKERARTLVPEAAEIVSRGGADVVVRINRPLRLAVRDIEALSMPKQMAVIAARAAGIMPLGFIGSIAEFHDLEGFRATIRHSRRFGFIGASVIHPSQVPILNEEFRPSAEEVDHARRVVAAYDTALAEGVGGVTVDGKNDRRAGRRARAAASRARGGDRRPRGEDDPCRPLIRSAISGILACSVAPGSARHLRRHNGQRLSPGRGNSCCHVGL